MNGNPSVYVDRKNQVAQNTYDGLDRLTQIQYADLSTITYTYDAGNRVTQIVDSINGTITRGYDGLNRLTQITQGTATVTIGYDDANRRTSLTLPNGVVVAYGYDAASRVTSISYTQGMTSIGNLTYTYDANGRRTSMGGSLAKVNLPAAITSTTYNANNQLTNWNGTTLSYDLDGNMTYDGATTYTWDARNRLGAFGSTTFTYDSFGRRTRNATGITFLYDGVNAVQELSGSTVTANLLTGGVDEIFTRTDSGGTRNFLGDALGSTLALTDSTGTVQTQYSYEPFGKTTATGSASSSTFQYTGRENDGTGMYYYRARYYNPTLGRFISEDPLGFGAGPNFYSYCDDNTISCIDPTGLDSLLFGVNGSATVVGGGEASAGVLINNDQGSKDFGVFGSVGAAVGLNLSASVFVGNIYGDSSKVAGQTVNVNLGLGPLGYTRIYDPTTGQLLGWTVGLGARLPVPPVSASLSYDITGTCSFRLGCTGGGNGAGSAPGNAQMWPWPGPNGPHRPGRK